MDVLAFMYVSHLCGSDMPQCYSRATTEGITDGRSQLAVASSSYVAGMFRLEMGGEVRDGTVHTRF